MSREDKCDEDKFDDIMFKLVLKYTYEHITI